MGMGANIRALREAKGWTLDKLSEVSGVEVGTISALENRNSQRSKFVHKLAKALGVDVAQLQGESVPDFPGTDSTPLTKDKVELLTAYDDLLQEQQAAVLADVRLKAAENRRNYEAMQKKFGTTGVVPDNVVGVHIKPRPAQREFPIEPPPKGRMRKAKRR